MITVKQILEQYSLETDKATADEIKLAELSDAGLFESSKLPMIKRSLNKNVNEMTEAEKKTLKYLLESLMTHVLVEKNQKVDKSAYPSDKDMPTVIILKRKAIRVFPDNQKIGMYYSQALDRYISIPFGPNVKDLSPQLNEERIDEISQELATRAYAKRMSKIKDIEDDEDKDPAEKAIASAKQKEKLKQLSYRMRTTATDSTGKNIRPWAGTSAVKTAKNAGRLQIAANKNAKGIPDKDRYMNALPGERVHMKRNLGYNPPASSIISGSDHPGLAAVATASAAVADFFRKTPKMPVKESFRDNLQQIREERQLDEVSWEDVKSGAKKAAEIAGDVTGISDVGSAIGKAREGDYSDAAWDAAKGVGKGILTVGTGGAASAGIRGAIAGVRALRAGRGVAAAARTAKRSAITSKGGRLARGIVRGAGKLAAGAAGLGAAAAGALSGIGDLAKPTDQNRPEFGSIKPQISGPGERSNLSGQEVSKQRQIFGQNESTISTLKQIVENNISSHTIQIGEETISINKSIAKKIIKLHESLNRKNKNKLEKMLNEDITSLTKVINFAIKQ